jgi:hypothetical protein
MRIPAPFPEHLAFEVEAFPSGRHGRVLLILLTAVHGIAGVGGNFSWSEKDGWQATGHGERSLISTLDSIEARIGVRSPPSQRKFVLTFLSDPVSLWEALSVMEA